MEPSARPRFDPLDDIERRGGGGHRRILLIDSTPDAAARFGRILCPAHLNVPGHTPEAEPTTSSAPYQFQLDCAREQHEGIDLVRQARAQGRPYALAFVDAPTGAGKESTAAVSRIWQQDPHMQIVICGVYSDAEWAQFRARLAHRDQVMLLTKPFEGIEALQLADALAERWRLARNERERMRTLEARIRERARDAEAMRSIDAQLEDAGRARVAPTQGARETGACRSAPPGCCFPNIRRRLREPLAGAHFKAPSRAAARSAAADRSVW